MRAAKYAIEVARLQKAQILCIHLIASLPYGYGPAGSAVEQYFEDAKDQAQPWFNKVVEIAKKQGRGDDDDDSSSGVIDIRTDIFMYVKSITDAIIDYASDKNIDEGNN